MKPRIIHVTDHAALRWRQRIARTECFNVYDIIDTVRKSKVVRKSDLLPFNCVRHPNTLYTCNEEVLFIFEPVTIDEFRLVTIITRSENYVPRVPRSTKKWKPPVEVEEKTKKVRKKRPARDKRIKFDEEC